MNNTVKSLPPVTARIIEAMNKSGVATKDLARAADMTYEHARRITKGITIPSKRMLRDICDILMLDFSEMSRLAIEANVERKYGAVLSARRPGNPEIAPIENAWGSLNAQQKEQIIRLTSGWAEKNAAKVG